jgi:hypothetical protein
MQSLDVNPWMQREVFQLGMGLFHLCLNLVWALLHIHWGSIDKMGSLTYFFVLMEKTYLGADHPNYHTLLAALTQTLHGLILNAWQTDCGFLSLQTFAESKPTPDQLLSLAWDIIIRHASPVIKPNCDFAHESTRLLTHDLLYVEVLIHAISDGDFG